MQKNIFDQSKLWVIKVGSSILTDENGKPDFKIFKQIAKEVSYLIENKKQVIIVSSGAIACGMSLIGLNKKPDQIQKKQAIAAAGQIALMNLYQKAFAQQKKNIAQVLLTRADLSHRDRYLNARHALHELLRLSIIPIINENDTVAVDEIKFGDNDNLSALVTNLAEADLLVLLTDQKGVYTADPRQNKQAEKISVIEDISQQVLSYAGNTSGKTTTGGMITKLEAAQKAASYGVPTIIASGKQKNVLQKIAQGLNEGTLILAKKSEERLSRRQHWILYSLNSAGKIKVDAGAKKMILEKGKSLLASGILDLEGMFSRGEAVELIDEENLVFAKGLVNYSAEDLLKIKRKKSSEIKKILGYEYSQEIVHRDDLVMSEVIHA